MTLRQEIAIILALAAACGDNGDTGTTASNTTPTTVQMTDSPSTLTESDTLNTSSSSNTNSGLTDETMTSPTASTTSTGENAPVFLSLGTNVNAITEGESVVFTALLTDPDGVDDIVGGSLTNEDGAIDFGPFVAAGQEGTYSITISWAQIHQAAPIQFEDVAETRVFHARFFDQAANSSTKSVSVNLQCAGGSACGGACTDLAVDGVNCGTCGHSCMAMGCEAGNCKPAWSECFTVADGFSSCDEMCQSLGEACAESQCAGNTTRYLGAQSECGEDMGGVPQDDSCSKVQDWGFPAIKCCCTDSN